MPSYKPPVQDMTFLLKDVLKAPERTSDIPAYASNDWEMSRMLLESAADFAQKIAFPLNQTGDQQGCTFNKTDFRVKTPDGFKRGYDEFCNLGMIGLTGEEKYGGMSQPHYLAIAANEIMTAANFSLTTYGGLTGGAAKVIARFAPDEIKDLYLPKMYTGEWTGTMCLTEPDSGSDLGTVATKAEEQADGTFKVSGSKIFITSGEHDLAGNICHLVLAHLPGAPAGTKGISLFLVPKMMPDANGNLIGKNGVACTGIEHKMGIHGSSTCSMSFDGATGYLIGNKNEGLKAMFTMMNDARMGVTSQGIGIADAATQSAFDYACIRLQGKALQDSFNENAKSAAIIRHANVRRDLIDMMSQVQGYRALELEGAIQLDISEHHPDAAARKSAEEIISLLTPVLKSNATDLACAAAQKSIQLHGGMGFITETGVEQYYRDSIIGTIYEGTNDIQSMDFTFRKAANMASFLKPMVAELQAAGTNPALQEYAMILGNSLKSLQTTAQNMGAKAKEGKMDDVLIHSRDFMDMFGKVAVGRMWLKMMTAAENLSPNAADDATKEFYQTKMLLGDNFIKRIMAPQVAYYEARINASVRPIHKLGEKQLKPK